MRSFLQLRRLEAAREIAQTVANSSNRVMLDADSLLLNRAWLDCARCGRPRRSERGCHRGPAREALICRSLALHDPMYCTDASQRPRSSSDCACAAAREAFRLAIRLVVSLPSTSGLLAADLCDGLVLAHALAISTRPRHRVAVSVPTSLALQFSCGRRVHSCAASPRCAPRRPAPRGSR